MTHPETRRTTETRTWIARQFTRVEDVVYVALGVLLSACAATLLVAGAVDFVTSLLAGTLADRIVQMLDRILLVLLVVELLYTVQVSFREHSLVPEPFDSQRRRSLRDRR